jgi:hypothetical protein
MLPSLEHEQNRRALLSFVAGELSLASRFCSTMKEADRTSEVYIKGAKRARLALQRAEELMWELDAPHQQLDQLTSQIERLRFELAGMA